jgi:hypothetical protein
MITSASEATRKDSTIPPRQLYVFARPHSPESASGRARSAVPRADAIISNVIVSRLAILGLTVFLGITPIAVHAQVPVQSQIDFNTARSDAALGTSLVPANLPTFGSIVSFGILPIENAASSFQQKPVPLPVNPFTFNFLSPLNYFNGSGGTLGSATAAEATPEMKLGFSVHPEDVTLQFSGFIDEASDRFSGKPPDTDKLSGSLRIDFVGTKTFPDRDRYIPYLSYSPQQGYAALFGKSKPFTQDVTVGLNKLWDFHPDWTKLDMRAGGNPTWETGLQIGVQRRMVNAGANSTAILAGPSLKWANSNRQEWPHCLPEECGSLAASLGINLARRWFDQVTGESERVWGAAPILTVAWGLPDRFVGGNATRFGSPEIDFQAAYNDQSSTDDAHSNRQWTVGLVVKAGLTF